MEAFHGSWSVASQLVGKTFLEICDQISKSPELLRIFKQHPAFIPVIGNDIRSSTQTLLLCNKVKDSADIIRRLPKWKTNDTIGDPYIYDMPEPFGKISPGTMIFVEEVLDIHTHLVNMFINELSIIEIGGGYGGLAKIIKDISQREFSMHEYSIVDYQEVLNLSWKYNSLFGHNIISIPINDIKVQPYYDLVISNWCLSELDDVGIKYYYDTIIRNCKYGYFKMNLWDEPRKQWVIELFKRDFKKVVVTQMDEWKPGLFNWKLMVSK